MQVGRLIYVSFNYNYSTRSTISNVFKINKYNKAFGKKDLLWNNNVIACGHILIYQIKIKYYVKCICMF